MRLACQSRCPLFSVARLFGHGAGVQRSAFYRMVARIVGGYALVSSQCVRTKNGNQRNPSSVAYSVSPHSRRTIVQRLIDGFHRFQKESFLPLQTLFEQLAEGQHPETLFITCSDSRIDPTLLTNAQPGWR